MWLVATAPEDCTPYLRGNALSTDRTALQRGAASFDRQPGGATGVPGRHGDIHLSDGNTGTFAYTVNAEAQTKEHHTGTIPPACRDPLPVVSRVLFAKALRRRPHYRRSCPGVVRNGPPRS